MLIKTVGIKVSFQSKVTGHSSMHVVSQLWELTCHMGSQCYLPPGRDDITALTPAKLDLATPELT